MHANSSQMKSQSVLLSSLVGLWRPLAIGCVFVALVWVMVGVQTGAWQLSFEQGLLSAAAPALVLAAITGPLQAARARSSRYTPASSLRSVGLALFAAAWAGFWVLPFNLVIFAKHGFALPVQENLTYVAGLSAGGALLSFIRGKA